MRPQTYLPVIISILIIITIAVVQRQSKYVAAITATMPLNVALGYWVVAASARTTSAASASVEQQALTDFSRGMLLSILPTLGFLLVLWLASRAHIKPLPALGLGYAAWALGTALIVFLRRQLLGGA